MRGAEPDGSRRSRRRWRCVGVAAAGVCAVAALVATAVRSQERPPTRFHTSRTSPRELPLPPEDDAFTFAIFGDRTGGPAEGVTVLQQAVADVNLLGPDLVMTVGDLVQGYNARAAWISEAKQYRAIMDRLAMPWFPVAGNHDIYWRGPEKPPDEHAGDYEQHFGPLWYAFSHKGCWFIVLFSDEGDPETHVHAFDVAAAQRMSPAQFAWLQAILGRAKGARAIFCFLHHPRWFAGDSSGHGQYGDDWARVHALLREAGNVRAVFAGHLHRMTYAGRPDGIEYFTLAATGGDLRGDAPLDGHLHHFDLVTVRGGALAVAAVPVGTVLDPRLVGHGLRRTTETAVLPRTDWRLPDGEARVARFTLRVPAVAIPTPELRLGIGHSFDDTGDRGLVWRVRDAAGRLVREGFASSTGPIWVRLAVQPETTWLLELEDADTDATGAHPGNAGTIEAVLRH